MNTKEIEIRFNLPPLEYKRIYKILKKDKSKLNKSAQYDIYFCRNSFIQNHTTNKSPFVIRIRKMKEKSELAYKSFQKEGSWIEIETTIDNPVAMEKILKHLNIQPYLYIHKTRISTYLNSIEINLDKIKKLGSFIEFEKKAKDVKKGQVELLKFAQEKFNLDKSCLIEKGYVQLAEEKYFESI